MPVEVIEGKVLRMPRDVLIDFEDYRRPLEWIWSRAHDINSLGDLLLADTLLSTS
jgi:hypothetical protein